MPSFYFPKNKGLILCSAKISGHHRSAFLPLALDTGATNTIISLKTAQALGLLKNQKKQVTMVIATSGGNKTCPVIAIPEFSCLGITKRNLQVICYDLPSKRPVEGLLGLNFFKGMQMVIDFQKGLITLHRPA